jgi:acyl-homoserine lactone acylase PvdQ
MPWSFTVFKPLFHREVPAGGNGNTPNVAKYNFEKTMNDTKFRSDFSATYRQIVTFSDNPQDTEGLYIHEGGQSGNLLAGHYFDMNSGHVGG